MSLSKGNKNQIWFAHMEIDANSKSKILIALNDELNINENTIFQNQNTSNEIINNYSEMINDINAFYDILNSKIK